MLACLMDNTKQIHEAIGYGAIDIEDETYFDGLDGIEITRVGDPERQMVLKIDDHLFDKEDEKHVKEARTAKIYSPSTRRRQGQ